VYHEATANNLDDSSDEERFLKLHEARVGEWSSQIKDFKKIRRHTGS
jgi:hypothetical protein